MRRRRYGVLDPLVACRGCARDFALRIGKPCRRSAHQGDHFRSAEAAATGTIGFGERLANGKKACAQSIPAGQKTYVASVASRGGARLISYSYEAAGGNTSSYLTRFKANCTSLVTTKIADQSFAPSAAWTDHSLVVISAGTAGLQTWTSGPNLCDQPVP
jgi:hypothetical protein